ncbi:MAG: exonuclease domain-containing protein [Clostridia bacterium]|nr:exonuclease domain-containing protein [Clostridia bacterium]
MILEEINAITNKYVSLRLRSTVLDKLRKEIVYTFSSPYRLSKEQQGELFQLVTQHSDHDYGACILYQLDLATEQAVEEELYRYIDECLPSLSLRVKDKIEICVKGQPDSADQSITVTFCVDELTANILQNAQYIDQIAHHFATYSCYKYEFTINTCAKKQDFDQLLHKIENYQQLQVNKEISKPTRYMKVDKVTQLIGKEITLTKAKFIQDITSPMRKVTLCGEVSAPRVKVSDKISSTICLFNLIDTTAQIPCVLFAKGDSVKKFERLVSGDEIIVSGIAEIDSYSKNLQIKVFDISRCSVLPLDKQPDYTKKAPTSYALIRPKPFTMDRQLEMYEKEQIFLSTFLAENDIVVMDIITTGNKVVQDKIVSVDALKIRNGIIKEVFSTYINPELSADAQITLPEGISAKSIAKSPTIQEVMPDLYKFCADCLLVVEDYDLVMSFLRYYANPSGYYWSNQAVTFEAIARGHYSNQKYSAERPSNYSIDSLADKLSIKVNTTRRLNKVAKMAHIFIKIVSIDENCTKVLA